MCSSAPARRMSSSFSACGSLREDIAPGAFVIVDQFIDRTCARASSFFGAGCIAHVSMAEPVSPFLRRRSSPPPRPPSASSSSDGGTYLIIEGPQFSSRAESRALPKLGRRSHRHDQHAGGQARPGGRASVCRDRHGHRFRLLASRSPSRRCRRGDAGHEDEWRQRPAARASASPGTFPAKAAPCPIGSDRALDDAIVTPRRFRDPRLMRKLSAITRRVLAAESLPQASASLTWPSDARPFAPRRQCAHRCRPSRTWPACAAAAGR